MHSLNQRGTALCRACESSRLNIILDLGSSPVANSLPDFQSEVNEALYPLKLAVCEECDLGQIGEYETPDEIFTVYPYLSSTSSTWIEHGRNFTQRILGEHHKIKIGYVLEIASNDGYLLQHFKSEGIQVLGVEPASNVAEIARQIGIPTISEFFGVDLAKRILNEYGSPSLIIANNVAAHVPDMLDFFSGVALLCNSNTIVTIENPSLGYLYNKKYYDTIYHEHFSYLSVKPISKLASKVGLELFRVDDLPTHGGSLRYYLAKKNSYAVDKSVQVIQNEENARGVGSEDISRKFANEVMHSVGELRSWVESQDDNSIIGFGAAAKTVTTFHAAKLDESKFSCIVDSNPLKQGKRLPGTSLSICSPEILSSVTGKVLIFPWNIHQEIGNYVSAMNPKLEVWMHNPVFKMEF